MKESQSRVKKKSEERDDLETIKAAAWAVFQHNNGGGSNSNRHPGYVLVQRATRFKLEAQMKEKLEHCSLAAKEALPSWDAGSTLFDKYELHSVFKHLDLAFQSVDTPQNVTLHGGSGYYEETTKHARDEYSRGHTESQRLPNQRNWLETVSESQRFRGSYLESADESEPPSDAGQEQDVVNGNNNNNEEPLKPNLVTDVEVWKDVPEVVPLGKVLKTMQFIRTSNRWNVLNGRRFSFDASMESKQSKKSKLLAIFRSKSGKDGTPPKPSRQARIVPDDTSQKGRKSKSLEKLRKSGELVVKAVVADTHDSDSSDSDDDDDYEAQGYPRKGISPRGLKSVLAPNFSRAVRLSSDMSNPNPEEGLRDHLRHGDLTYGRIRVPTSPTTPPSPTTPRRKSSYSLNVTSPVQTPRRTMLDGSRPEDFDLNDHHHHHYHHHHHHHHIAHQGDDYELTVPDIVRRVSRKSFEEVAYRLSTEEISTGGKAPRNSLESPFLNTPTPGSKLFV